MKGDDSFRTTPMSALLNSKPHLRFTRGKWVAYPIPLTPHYNLTGCDARTLNRQARIFAMELIQ